MNYKECKYMNFPIIFIKLNEIKYYCGNEELLEIYINLEKIESIQPLRNNKESSEVIYCGHKVTVKESVDEINKKISDIINKAF